MHLKVFIGLCLLTLGVACVKREPQWRPPSEEIGTGYFRLKMNGAQKILPCEAVLSADNAAHSLYSLSITHRDDKGNSLIIYMKVNLKKLLKTRLVPTPNFFLLPDDTTTYVAQYAVRQRANYIATSTFPDRNDTLVFTRYDDKVLAGRVQFRLTPMNWSYFISRPEDIEVSEGEFWIDLQKK